jgi:hypothetical protein
MLRWDRLEDPIGIVRGFVRPVEHPTRAAMTDLDENALIVNALQRQASVLVKKSRQEGFGLGAIEGVWKARPVVATRIFVASWAARASPNYGSTPRRFTAAAASRTPMTRRPRRVTITPCTSHCQRKARRPAG